MYKSIVPICCRRQDNYQIVWKVRATRYLFYMGKIVSKSLSRSHYCIWIYQFSLNWFFPFLRKIALLQELFVSTSNTEYRPVMKFFTRKGLSTIQITKELADVYSHSAPSYRTVAKWVVEFNDPIRAFQDASRSGRPSTALTHESIRAVHKKSWCVINKFLFDA